HDSVLETAKLAAARFGVRLDIVRVTRDGIVDLEHLAQLLTSSVVSAQAGTQSLSLDFRFRGDDRNIALISIQAANNETGVIQPSDEIAALARKHNALFHTDAVQMAGRLPFNASPYDLVTLSAHKLGGISGAGALIVREGINIAPLVGG